jgi:dienelactone hydrolase
MSSRRSAATRLSIAFVLVCGLALPAASQSPGPQDAERKAANREQVWRVPSGGAPLMLTTVFRPPGEARAPLVVINHGSPPDGNARAGMPRQRYSALSSWFVARGYVVAVPLRRGYGDTGGGWAEEFGSCNNPDFARAGLTTAADIRAAIDYMRSQPFVAVDRTVVVGQSAGGWGSLALASTNPPGLAGIVNFAGGRGGQSTALGSDSHKNCSANALVAAAGRFGATARVPSLWIYTANDSFFRPELAQRMVGAYTAAGGRATYRPLAPAGKDGHNFSTQENSSQVWSPIVAEFLGTRR